jgi:hypothetical protein
MYSIGGKPSRPKSRAELSLFVSCAYYSKLSDLLYYYTIACRQSTDPGRQPRSFLLLGQRFGFSRNHASHEGFQADPDHRDHVPSSKRGSMGMFSWASDAPHDGRWDTLPQVPSAVPSNWMPVYGEMYTTFLRSVASYPVSMRLMTL